MRLCGSLGVICSMDYAKSAVVFALLLFALTLGLAGCGGEQAAGAVPADAGAPEADAAGPCSAGEMLLDGGGCEPAGLPPNMPCPPGETPSETGDCCPAGTTPLGDGNCPPDVVPERILVLFVRPIREV